MSTVTTYMVRVSKVKKERRIHFSLNISVERRLREGQMRSESHVSLTTLKFSNVKRHKPFSWLGRRVYNKDGLFM